uniref:RNA-dependent RNA polymerase n=1 Tax=Plasmopara viticola lesion associated narnavirus 37 TaxID=2719522 RepID=A0A6G9RVH6_9VIRU|nr:RNA-dependent RNA polymerase [Plasmopara viticola lesion associated narnavirus 37]
MPLDEAWDYEYESLFFEGIGERQKWRFPFLPKAQKVQFLKDRTYWYNRLKPNCKIMVKNLLDEKVLHLKEILHVVDGVMVTAITSFPEIFMVRDGQDPYFHTDRLINNIITNCLFNYSKVVKEIKSFRKTLKKAAFERRRLEVSDKYRSISWANSIIRVYSRFASTNSKAKMFRIGTFCQTRATGLGDSKMVQETIDQFIETVTKVTPFEPDSLLVKARDQVIERIVLNTQGTNAHFRMSMSTSGCTEMGRSKGGKFDYLRQLIKESVVEPPLEFSVNNQGGELGTPLWKMAFEKGDAGSADIYKVNVAGVRENGKVRVVTSGSFWKETLLQPFSHMTIEMVKSEPSLRDSLRAGRLGYTFIQGVDINDPVRGDVIFEKDPVAVSCDWEKATDYPSHASGRFTLGPLLAKTGLSDSQVNTILDTWVGDYDLFVSGKPVGKMVNGIPMGNPLTKTNISIAHPICELYAHLRIQDETSSGSLIRDFSKGRTQSLIVGNGDDSFILVWGQFKMQFIEYFGIAAAMLGYKISKDDFFTTRDWGTYCEEIFRIPTSRFDTVWLANRIKDARYSPYLDFPKGRLLIDTQKDRSDFSSEPEGKFTLLGKDMEYVRRDGEQGTNFLFAVSSALQDIGLGLRYRNIPVYLPRQIFSIGKMPPNWSIDSWVNCMNTTKRAWIKNVTQTLLEEFNGKREPCLSLFKGAMNKSQKHFNKEAYLEIREIPDTDPIKQHVIIKADDWEKFPVNTLMKLTNAGYLVRESQITKHYLFFDRLKSLTDDSDRDLFKVIKGIGLELSTYEDRKFREEATEFSRMYKKKPHLLLNAHPEDLYPESIGKALAQADPLRVDLDYGFLKNFHSRIRPDSPYTRGVERLYEWFTDNYINILRGLPFEQPPQDVIEDDPIIIQTAANLVATGCDVIVYVTDDVKLVRASYNKGLSATHLRISCRDWVSIAGDETSVLRAVSKWFAGSHPQVIIDQGSLETFIDKTGSSYSLGVPIKESQPLGWNDEIVKPEQPTTMELLSRYHVHRKVTDDLVIGLLRYRDRKDEISIAQFTRSQRKLR